MTSRPRSGRLSVLIEKQQLARARFRVRPPLGLCDGVGATIRGPHRQPEGVRLSIRSETSGRPQRATACSPKGRSALRGLVPRFYAVVYGQKMNPRHSVRGMFSGIASNARSSACGKSRTIGRPTSRRQSITVPWPPLTRGRSVRINRTPCREPNRPTVTAILRTELHGNWYVGTNQPNHHRLGAMTAPASSMNTEIRGQVRVHTAGSEAADKQNHGASVLVLMLIHKGRHHGCIGTGAP